MLGYESDMGKSDGKAGVKNLCDSEISDYREIENYDWMDLGLLPSL